MEFQNGKEDFINKLNINFRTLLTYGKDELIQVGEFIVKDIVMDEIPDEYAGLISPRDTARVVFQEVENENVELVLPFNEFMTKYIELANKNASTLDIEANLEKSLSKVENEAAIKIFNDETLKKTLEVDTLTLEESQAEYFRDGEPQSSNYSICPINLGKCRKRILERHKVIEEDEMDRER